MLLICDVCACVRAKVIFYMAPAIMAPSLFLEIQAAEWSAGDGGAASAYAAVLTTTTIVAMAAPIPFGIWAERRGEREVYVGVTIAATLAALVLAVAPQITWWRLGLPTFALAWGCLSAPLSLRGVRAAYFARHIAPEELSRTGQLASAAGLFGSVAGPLLASVSHNAFLPAALFAAAAHAVAALLLFVHLPKKAATASTSEHELATPATGLPVTCERCAVPLTIDERRYNTELCDRCWDTWFRSFKRRALLGFCAVAALLELSMNAAVVAPFQPIAVERLGWGSDEIAKVRERSPPRRPAPPRLPTRAAAPPDPRRRSTCSRRLSQLWCRSLLHSCDSQSGRRRARPGHCAWWPHPTSTDRLRRLLPSPRTLPHAASPLASPLRSWRHRRCTSARPSRSPSRRCSSGASSSASSSASRPRSYSWPRSQRPSRA